MYISFIYEGEGFQVKRNRGELIWAFKLLLLQKVYPDGLSFLSLIV